jgi:hypothetical protein
MPVDLAYKVIHAVKNAVATEQGVLDVEGEGPDQTGDLEANRSAGE